jgi:hypothetical protein
MFLDSNLMHIRRLLGCLYTAWLACSFLPAAEHQGVVKFGGLPLPGATVTAVQGEKRWVTVTDPQGFYSFPDLADGAWTLRVEMQCFAPAHREVATGANTTAEWELDLLPLDEIRSAAPASTPATSPAAAANATASQPVPGPKVETAQRKTSRAGGKAAPAVGNTSSGFQRTEAAAAGDAAKITGENEPVPPSGEADQSAVDGFLINGSVNNGASTPFAQSAAFGNNRKGPRSLYNGSLGLTLDNSAFDARSFSLTGLDTPKPDYNRMQGLASFGGPLKIPHLLPRNGPNVILNYQWTRNRDASTRASLMPTLAERRGDFSQTRNALGQPFDIFDPSNGLPFPGRIIPENRISPQAKALLAFYPLPNFASSRYNYQIPLTGSTHQDSLQARVSKSVRNTNQINGAFALQSARSDNTNLFEFLDTGRTLGINSSINWMHRFNQRTFATFGSQFSRFSLRTRPHFSERRNVSGDAGITGNNQEPVNWGPPNLSFSSGMAGLSDAQRAVTRNQTIGVSGYLFLTRGSHNIGAGAGFRRQQFNSFAQQDPRGTFTFTGAAAGNDFAGFLLGIPDTSSIAFGNADKYFRASSYDVFVNDDWRFHPSLTINCGLRWEYSAPLTELYGRLVNLDIASGFTAIAPVIAANPSGSLTGRRYPDSLLSPDKNALQPRIGLSWRPFAASSTVVRAGYGVYYDTSVYLAIASRMAQQSPLSRSLSLQNSAPNPLTLANGFYAPPNLVLNTFAVDPNFRIGYAQTWQLSVQRDLPASLVMTATYLGTKGTRAQQQFLPNTYPAGAVNPCPACPSGFAYLTSNGNSTRQSGTFQLRRRLHSGIAGQLSYTFAKAIDNAALSGRGQPAVTAQDWLNLSGERGLSSFDQRHLLNAQMQYTTGMGLRGGTLVGGWKGRLFKDWTISTQITKGSGLPLTPVYPSAVRGTGFTGSIRPDYTGAPIHAAPSGLFLNPAAVAPPASGRWGNAGRNSIIGPGQFTLNASMGRTFRFSDRVSGDFRLDAVNALNHVTFLSWNATATSPQFGVPVSPNPMRTVQTSLRVRF